MATVGHGRTCVPDFCGSWQDLCTEMSTVSHGRSGVLRWPQWVMAGPVYLTSVGHGRTCVPRYVLICVPDFCESWQDLCTGMSTVSYGRSGVLRWPQCVMAGPVYRDVHCELW
ncbi:hypothetical protein J6590_079255 [Homalodisca vitripennis]|nr:hypothetical protein J6590_079255 [Homalodisca vitripennis]